MKAKRVIFIILFLALLLVFAYSAYRVTGTLHEYSESDRYYEKTRQVAVSTQPPSQSAGRQSSDGETVPVPADRSPMTVDFDALMQLCPDARAWLCLPDTVIDYPVVQGRDNDYYLHHLLDGSENPGGSLFLDFRSPSDFTGWNTLIYGHNMSDGSMFHTLPRFKEQSFYEQHPFLYLNTPQGDYRLEVFACFVTWHDSRVYIRDFGSRTEFMEWVDLMRSYSDISSDVEVGPDDRIVTLSTCSYEYDDARYVVMTKLVPLDG